MEEKEIFDPVTVHYQEGNVKDDVEEAKELFWMIGRNNNPEG